MKAKCSQTLSVVLAIQCGIWVAFAPVLSEMHQAVADHHHVFCPEHNRIEDARLVSAPDHLVEEDLVNQDHGRRVFGVFCSLAWGTSDLECVFSNFSVHACSKASVQVTGRHVTEKRAIPPLFDANFRIANTLDIAPKNSPPVGS
jgi:hypothetical protein